MDHLVKLVKLIIDLPNALKAISLIPGALSSAFAVFADLPIGVAAGVALLLFALTVPGLAWWWHSKQHKAQKTSSRIAFDIGDSHVELGKVRIRNQEQSIKARRSSFKANDADIE